MRKLYSVLFSIVFVTNSFAQVPTNGLVSEWLFDNSSITNGSNSLLAILGGSPTAAFATDRLGNPNSAINVNPGGFINFAGDEFDAYTTGANAQFSFSFWIKLDAFDNAYRCIFAKATFESVCQIPGRQFAVLINPSRKLQFQGFGTLTGGNQIRVDGDQTLAIGTWHHVVISVDVATWIASLPGSTGVKMYLDGVLQNNTVSEFQGQSLSATGMQNGPAHFGFGTYLNTAGASCAATQDIDAHFDDFRIYDRILTPQEVEELQFDGCDEIVVTQPLQEIATCNTTADLSFQTNAIATVQWQKLNTNGSWLDVNLPEVGTDFTLSLTGSERGVYRAEITNGCGSVTYTEGVAAAIQGPVFRDSQHVAPEYYLCSGTTDIELAANAVGEGITYQWYVQDGFNWLPISGADQSTYTANAGNYQVQIFACGSNLTSATKFVITALNNTVTVAGFVPGSGTICLGQTVGIILQTNTSSTFEWTPVEGTLNGATLSVSPTETTTYNITATSWQGCPATTTATVTVNDPTTEITENNGVLELSGGPFTQIQWYWNGNVIPGAGFDTYTPTADGSYWATVQLNGCSYTATAYNYTGIATGIVDGAANGLKVYPNPFNAEFIIETTELTSVSVMNAMGEVVLTQTVKGRTSIDASNLSTGIYFVREETSGAVMKLVKN